MLIKKIEIVNFRQFKGLQSIEFSKDPDKNITLILGDNTSGKTTLLQAFLWCFYGKVNFKLRDALLNQTIKEEMVFHSKAMETMSVTIELTHQDLEYIITRTLKHHLRNKDVKTDNFSELKVSYKMEDGQTKSFEGKDNQRKVEEILPEDLSSYFFYDTERFGNVSDKTDVTAAVKGLLGLTVLKNTMNHIGRETQSDTVLGALFNSLSDKDDLVAINAKIKFEQAENEKKVLLDRIQVAEEEKRIKVVRNIEVQDILKDMTSSSKLQRERESKELKLKSETIGLVREEINYLKNFNDKSYLFFARPLINRALEKLENAEVSDKGIRDMNANSIEHIIQRGICVCGTCIEIGNDAHLKLIEELEYLPPKSIGLLISNFVNSASAYRSSSDRYSENLQKSYIDILKNKQRVSFLTDEIKDISNEINKNIASKDYEQELISNQSKIDNLDEKINNFSISMGEQDQIIRENKRIYQSTIGVSEKNKEIRLHMAYAEEIYKWIANSYFSKEKTIRIEMEEKVNKYFTQIYHGNRRVEIDDKYRVTLITKTNDIDIVTDESGGLETVKNFSFIAGLMDLAKNKLTKKDDVDVDSEAFPLILDAPFSNADVKHVNNISKVLPTIAEQLILIVMSKDWNYAEEEIGDKVGKRYVLEKKSEIETIIKEA
ncbi:AAA family ATPase [Sporosarcina siberiensis]|uniref:Nuclease SbcCD subunit C n=1 Tax=Sporosarcina siberiensis TaxID=1365606 RepID=A0ABW4SJM2_9BACL